MSQILTQTDMPAAPPFVRQLGMTFDLVCPELNAWLADEDLPAATIKGEVSVLRHQRQVGAIIDAVNATSSLKADYEQWRSAIRDHLKANYTYETTTIATAERAQPLVLVKERGSVRDYIRTSNL